MNDKNEMSGELLARDARFVILVSRFNSLITEKLLTAARDTLLRHGASADRIDIVRVPGAFELPLAAKVLAAGGKYDAIVALGCVIRGATPHFDYVAGECARGLARVSVEFSMPLGFGVLTVDTIEQAIERAGTKGGNKGADAALSALEMADLMKKLE